MELSVFDDARVGLDERDAKLAVLDRAPVADARVRVLHVRRHAFVRVDDWAVKLRVEARILHLERKGVVTIAVKAVGIPKIRCIYNRVLDDNALLVRIERDLLHDLPAQRRRVASGAVSVARVEKPVGDAIKEFALQILVVDGNDFAALVDLDSVPAVFGCANGTLVDGR